MARPTRLVRRLDDDVWTSATETAKLYNTWAVGANPQYLGVDESAVIDLALWYFRDNLRQRIESQRVRDRSSKTPDTGDVGEIPF